MNYTIGQVRPEDSLWEHVPEHSPQTIRYMTDPNQETEEAELLRASLKRIRGAPEDEASGFDP